MKALILIIIALNLVSCNMVGNRSVSDLSSEPITVSVIKVQEAENEAKCKYVGNVEPSKIAVAVAGRAFALLVFRGTGCCG